MAYTFEFASAPVKLSALPRGAMRSLGQVIDPKTGFLPKKLSQKGPERVIGCRAASAGAGWVTSWPVLR